MSGRGAAGFEIDAHRHAAPALQPGLYVVATPIGNLEDITLRALRVLAAADRIYCEDTRITRRLLDRYSIHARPRVYDDHRGAAIRPQILEALDAGESVALVSDAGTPLISDPGFKLVRAARDRGFAVFTVPGASALTAAAATAGLATDAIYFAGFLAPRAAARRRAISGLSEVAATLVFYEAPHRLAQTLADLAELLGSREAAVARELTKMHEEVVRGTLDELAARFSREPARGEIVILVASAAPTVAASATIDQALRRALDHASLRDAAASVAAALGIPRAEAYSRALAIRAEGETGDGD